MDAIKRAPWGIAVYADRGALAIWSQYATLARITAVPWGIATATDRAAESLWGQYLNRPQRNLAGPWGISTATDRASVVPWGQYLARLGMVANVPWGVSAAADIHVPSPWGKYQQRLALVVDVPTETGAAAVIIPVKRSYIVINDVSLVRVSDSLELPATALKLSIDAESWIWGFSADLAGASLDDVVGDPGQPVELAATINGTEFRLLAERVARTRSFGRSGVSISGRGIAAVLDAPYAALASHYSTSAITAQQAAEAAVTSIELPSGWAIDWQITDWLLPAGLWSHQGGPVSAVTRIAAAAGAYVQADPLSKTLHILPRYGVAPWDWAGVTPDYEVPSAVATTEGIEWVDNPAYDVVYVSGEAGGILGKVLRTGAAGTLPAQMVTDNLITHADAARQRGISILGNTGRQAMISLSMPVLTPSGIIKPGSMVEYTDAATARIGVVRGVSVSADGIKVRQTIEVETHE